MGGRRGGMGGEGGGLTSPGEDTRSLVVRDGPELLMMQLGRRDIIPVKGRIPG